MIWLFERNTESIQIETRHDPVSGGFVLIVRRPDGTEQTERFADAESFRARLEIFETQLEGDNWARRGQVFLHDGWKLT
ncbi:MAG TPA: hypothetical protein VGZ27_00230 [Vicinamibacterales bacterium]|jgi:hypothetical protein|nr:hypothetical protein [Vicinamibacterales bacterium]